MDKLVEICLNYSGDDENPILIEINYPIAVIQESIEDKLNLANILIKDLKDQLLESERKHKEKDNDLSLFQFKLQEQEIKYEEDKKINDKKHLKITSDLEKINTNLKEKNDALIESNNKITELENFLESKTNLCLKLQKTLKDKEKNKSTAEVLLEKQEHMNKDLIEKNVKSEKMLQDTEKKYNECIRTIKKLKDEIDSSNEVMKQRDDQIKNVIKRVKIQESEISKLQDEIRKKDEIIKNFQGNMKDVSTVIETKNTSNIQKEYKKVLEIVNTKDNEIKIMKEMLKSFQLKQQRPHVISAANKNLKLPPINNSEKQIKSVEKHIKIKEPIHVNKKSLRENENSSFNKLRKDTPPPNKKTFKGAQLFPDKNENEFNFEDNVSAISNEDFSSQHVSDKSWNKPSEEEIKIEETPFVQKRTKNVSIRKRQNEGNSVSVIEKDQGSEKIFEHNKEISKSVLNIKTKDKGYDEKSVQELNNIKEEKIKNEENIEGNRLKNNKENKEETVYDKKEESKEENKENDKENDKEENSEVNKEESNEKNIKEHTIENKENKENIDEYKEEKIEESKEDYGEGVSYEQSQEKSLDFKQEKEEVKDDTYSDPHYSDDAQENVNDDSPKIPYDDEVNSQLSDQEGSYIQSDEEI